MVTCAGGSLNSIIDTHREVYSPKLRQKFIDNLGLDDSSAKQRCRPVFLLRDSSDLAYSMEIQRQSGVSLSVTRNGFIPRLAMCPAEFEAHLSA